MLEILFYSASIHFCDTKCGTRADRFPCPLKQCSGSDGSAKHRKNERALHHEKLRYKVLTRYHLVEKKKRGENWCGNTVGRGGKG